MKKNKLLPIVVAGGLLAGGLVVHNVTGPAPKRSEGSGGRPPGQRSGSNLALPAVPTNFIRTMAAVRSNLIISTNPAPKPPGHVRIEWPQMTNDRINGLHVMSGAGARFVTQYTEIHHGKDLMVWSNWPVLVTTNRPPVYVSNSERTDFFWITQYWK